WCHQSLHAIFGTTAPPPEQIQLHAFIHLSTLNKMYHDVSHSLEECNLTEKSCSYLTSALTSHSSSLTQLDLSDNELLDSGVKLLCSALSHHNCRLKELV